MPESKEDLYGGTGDRMMGNYAGISGGYYTGLESTDSNVVNVSNWGSCWAASNGVLFAHSKTTFGEITDGSSNVLLAGEQSAYRDAVLLNAAAAILVAGKVDNLKQGVEIAKESIDNGAAKAAVEKLAAVTSAA